jgi:endonuclease/exonuclease/phosphatase family metal-dependent hydrolase
MVTLNTREGAEAEVRRDGVERLAAATRALADAVAVTAVDRATRDEVTGARELLTQRLALETDTGEVGYGMHENMLVGIHRPSGFHTPDAQAP